MKRLRTYSPMSKRSAKVGAEAGAFAAVYRQVDQRSEGRCEVIEPKTTDPRPAALYRSVFARCPKRATDHHHCVKPRRAHHVAEEIIHLCRDHHDRCDWPYKRGRLVIIPVAGTFTFWVRYASDKFTAREVKEEI